MFRKKILALALTAVMAVSSLMVGSSVSAAEGDTQVLNLRTASFGNNYDVQDMGWRWMTIHSR